MEHHAFFENRTERFHAVSCPGFSFPPHLHPQLELLFVREGTAGITVGDHSAVLPKGSLVVIFPNQIHSYQSTEEGAVITRSLSHWRCWPMACGSAPEGILMYLPKRTGKAFPRIWPISVFPMRRRCCREPSSLLRKSEKKPALKASAPSFGFSAAIMAQPPWNTELRAEREKKVKSEEDFSCLMLPCCARPKL